MATVGTQRITRGGVAPTYAAASAGGDSFTPGDSTFLHVKNANAAACTVTFVTPGTVEGLAVADMTATVPATNGDLMIGPLPASLFRDSADGLADVTWSVTASVTFSVLAV